MKRLMYFFVATLSFAACHNNENTYKVTGTANGASDGDTVFMQEIVGRDLHKTDTAIIKNGKFTFTGRQDSAVNRYLTYMKNNNRYLTDFFLENGEIDIILNENSTVSGTPDNDVYQSFKNKMNALDQEENQLYESLQDTTLTQEQINQKKADLDAKDKEMTNLIVQTIQENITNPVGAHLLSRYNFIIDYEEIEPLLSKLPAQYQNNERIAHLKEQVNTARNTAVGQKYIDFEMPDVDGKEVKLSDFISKNKYTLIDFWASWCGPCRAEMPNLVKAYDEYKNKGFGIVGVSLDRDAQAWKKGIQALHITWPQMSDLKYWNSKGAQLYAVRSIPYTVLVDQQGTIIAKGLHGEALQKKLAELFK